MHPSVIGFAQFFAYLLIAGLIIRMVQIKAPNSPVTKALAVLFG